MRCKFQTQAQALASGRFRKFGSMLPVTPSVGPGGETEDELWARKLDSLPVPRLFAFALRYATSFSSAAGSRPEGLAFNNARRSASKRSNLSRIHIECNLACSSSITDPEAAIRRRAFDGRNFAIGGTRRRAEGSPAADVDLAKAALGRAKRIERKSQTGVREIERESSDSARRMKMVEPSKFEKIWKRRTRRRWCCPDEEAISAYMGAMLAAGVIAVGAPNATTVTRRSEPYTSTQLRWRPPNDRASCSSHPT